MQCPHLHAFCKFLWADSSDNPLIRLGLAQPCTETLQLQCCVFSGYHAMKRTVRSGELELSDSSDLCNRQIWRLWSVFADAYQAEAREHDCNYRRFSLAEFIIFLCNQPVASQPMQINSSAASWPVQLDGGVLSSSHASSQIADRSDNRESRRSSLGSPLSTIRPEIIYQHDDALYPPASRGAAAISLDGCVQIDSPSYQQT